MAIKPPETFHIRLTSVQRDRVKECSRYLGKPMTDFIRDATLDKIDIIEAKMKREAEERKPRGLDLKHTPPQAPAPAPKKATNELDRFISYVAAAESTEDQECRMKSILDIIIASSTPEEAKEIAARLDDEIAKEKTKNPLFGTVIPGL